MAYKNSKYWEAWLILKERKALSLILDTPAIDHRVRRAISEQKKLDPDKSPMERLRSRKEINAEGKLVIHFTLEPSVKVGDEFFFLEDD